MYVAASQFVVLSLHLVSSVFSWFVMHCGFGAISHIQSIPTVFSSLSTLTVKEVVLYHAQGTLLFAHSIAAKRRHLQNHMECNLASFGVSLKS